MPPSSHFSLDLRAAPPQAALDTISACLPAQRQTMLFSATVAPGVQAAALRFLKPDYKMVDTVGEDEGATNPQAR